MFPTIAKRPFAPVNDVGALASHADFRTRRVRFGNREIDVPVTPGHAPEGGVDIPEIGEHTEEILAELARR